MSTLVGSQELVGATVVAAMLGVSVKSVGNWVRAGTFSKPILLGGLARPSRRWRVEDIQAFIAGRDGQRGACAE